MTFRPPAAAAALAGAALAALAPAARAGAQTDYYNTDAGRPLTIEDAAPVERRAVEVQLAPLRLERAVGGVRRWGVEPEVAVGIFPRTHVEVGLPLVRVERPLPGAAGAAGVRRAVAGAAGVDVGVLHALNAETTRVPALAVGGGVLFPAGPLGPDHAYATVRALATRTFSGARLHLNAQGAFGPGLRVNPGGHLGALGGPVGGNTLELSRWLAGAAVDHVFGLRSLLVGAEAFARAPVVRGEAVEWNAGAGARWQLAPRWTVDGGAGRHLTGDDRGWYVTAGAAYSVGLPWAGPRGARR